jgi:hypothetical protein
MASVTLCQVVGLQNGFRTQIKDIDRADGLTVTESDKEEVVQNLPAVQLEM